MPLGLDAQAQPATITTIKAKEYVCLKSLKSLFCAAMS
jgi:hypothetical protein